MKSVLIATVLLLAGFGFSASACEPGTSSASCRRAVRHLVSRDMRRTASDFQGSTFRLSRSGGQRYQFSCQRNDRGHIHIVRVGPVPYVKSMTKVTRVVTFPPATEMASREMTPEQVDINNCTGAVDQKLQASGFSNMSIDSLQQLTVAGQQNVIAGSASAVSGSGTHTFGFTCHMNMTTGGVASMSVVQH